MNEVIRAAAALQAVCVAEAWRFCFIGGLAVQRWGEPRETVDVDLTLLTGFHDEARFVSPLIERFEPRIDRAADFARVNRVLLLRAPSGVGLDIALGGSRSKKPLWTDRACSRFRPTFRCAPVRPRTCWC